MAEERELQRYLRVGIILIIVGLGTAIAGALVAHFTGLPELDALNRELYPSIPRGWLFVLIGQIISLTGGFMIMGGMTLAFLYKRPMTWARAAIGGLLFTTLMMVLFGIIPNEWLTLTQAVWEWTPQKIALTVPAPLVLNNEIQISYAAVKDIVSGTYSIVALVAVALFMYRWQEHQKQVATAPPPQKVSEYGRPLTKLEV